MNKLIPTLGLATLLLACAQDAKHEEGSAQARASGEERASAAETKADARERRAAPAQHAATHETDAERIELEHRGDRDRIAGHDTIPARDPGNSKVNDRDRDGADITPLDQGNGEVDLDLTQNIRKGVIGDDSLSFSAKNVKIITRDGHVTLRGTVNSAAEKQTIFKTAVTLAGVGHVTNQLEVDD